MFKKANAIILTLVVSVFVACFVFSGSAYAANGTRELGFSSRDSAMAGATTASPYDTSCLVKNPAELIWIGNRVDGMYQNIITHGVSMDTEGPFGPFGLSAVGRKQDSTVTYLPGADVGVSYRIPGMDKHPVSVGLGIFTMAGLAADFPSSRINSLAIANGVYDKMVDLRSMRIAPGLAVGITDKLSFGGTANIGIQGLKTDMATVNPTAGFPETAGSGKWDFVPGGGFTLGLFYKFSEMLGLGACYESHQWMGYHYKYKDIPLHYLDEPPVISAGLSFKPIKDFEFTFDTRYINWTNVKTAALGPQEGGFGWRDQWVFAAGGEYTFKDMLKLRFGYNYGKSPIQPHVVFANALFSGPTIEQHLTTGFSYLVTKRFSVDFTWEHHFRSVKVDNGAGDLFSINGAGTKITAAADILSIGLGYKY